MGDAFAAHAADLLVGGLAAEAQEVEDELQLGVAVAGDVAAHAFAHGGVLLCQFGQPLGIGGDDGAAAIGRVRRAGDVSGLLEPVEQLGDGSGGQAQLLGQLARGCRAGWPWRG